MKPSYFKNKIYKRSKASRASWWSNVELESLLCNRVLFGFVQKGD